MAEPTVYRVWAVDRIAQLTRENEALRAIVTRLAEGERNDEGHTALRDAARAAIALKESGQ